MTYTSEKLYSAVRALALGTGSIQHRLESALLAMHTLTADDFDDADERQRFEAVWAVVDQAEPEADEGTIAAATRAMSADEAREVATTIFELDARYRPIG